MKITINTYDDLLRFIQNDKVTIAEAVQVFNKFLNVFFLSAIPRNTAYSETVKDLISKWGDYDGEKSLFPDIN